MEYGKFHLTWKERHLATRAALAGCEVTTPLELFIFMGGDPDNFTDEIDQECRSSLRAHGYKAEMVAVTFFGPLELQWLRHGLWPEDDQWPA